MRKFSAICLAAIIFQIDEEVMILRLLLKHCPELHSVANVLTSNLSRLSDYCLTYREMVVSMYQKGLLVTFWGSGSQPLLAPQTILLCGQIQVSANHIKMLALHMCVFPKKHILPKNKKNPFLILCK